MTLDGIQSHIDAVAKGEPVEFRLALIGASNCLSLEAKRTQAHFLKAFCLAAALEPLCGSEVDLGDGLCIRLNKPRHLLEGNDLPGVRVDGQGWLAVEGEFCDNGRIGMREDASGSPLWPFMVLNPSVTGSGPWQNFLPQALAIMRQGAEVWRYGD